MVLQENGPETNQEKNHLVTTREKTGTKRHKKEKVPQQEGERLTGPIDRK